MIYNLKINTNLIIGSNSLKSIVNQIDEENFKSVCVFVDYNAEKNNKLIKDFLKKIKNKFEIDLIFYKENFEPTYDYIDLLTKQIKKNKKKFDCFVCIGGGSVIDTCKAVAVTATNSGKAISFRGFPKNLNKPIPVIAIPTTAGTGSEIVFNASIIDQSKKIKMGINYYNNYPIYSVLEPRLIKSAPLNIIINSAFDTIVHALESFMSPINNSTTRSFSKESLKLSLITLPKVINNEKKIKHYQNLQISSCLAMIALSNTSSGATGALSYYLGTNYRVGHGLAGACFIGKICKFNHSNGYHDYSQIYDYIFPKNLYKNNKRKSKAFVDILNNLIKNSSIPRSITELGYKNSEINNFVSFYKNNKKPFSQNPIKFKIIDIKSIINSKY